MLATLRVELRKKIVGCESKRLAECLLSVIPLLAAVGLNTIPKMTQHFDDVRK